MIFFNRYNFPSFAAFFLLLTATCATLLFLEESEKICALFLIVWGVFGLARSLWILETAFLLEDADHQQRSVMLPWMLLSGMDLRARLDAGFQAMKSCDSVMLIWFLSGGLFCMWSVYVTITPAVPDALLVAAAKMALFFDGQFNVDGTHVVFDPDGGQWLVHISGIVIAGLVFWLSRTYALTLKDLRLGVISAALLFSLCAALTVIYGGFADGPDFVQGLWKGAGFGLVPVQISAGVLEPQHYSFLFVRSAEMGMGGVIFLYMPAALVTLAVFKNCFHPQPKRFFALAGLGVVALMFWADRSLSATSGGQALFISGWALVAVLWQASTLVLRKSYQLRQV